MYCLLIIISLDSWLSICWNIFLKISWCNEISTNMVWVIWWSSEQGDWIWPVSPGLPGWNSVQPGSPVLPGWNSVPPGSPGCLLYVSWL